MEIRWRVARIRQRGRLLPFLIEDVTPRSTRVPGGLAAEHPNGATGICRLELAALIGDGSLRLGACVLSSVDPGRNKEARERIAAVGPGPLVVELATGASGEAEELDRRLTHGVGILLQRRAED